MDEEAANSKISILKKKKINNNPHNGKGNLD